MYRTQLYFKKQPSQYEDLLNNINHDVLSLAFIHVAVGP